MDIIPLAAVVISLASTALFLKVGRTIQVRHVSPEARSAQVAFVGFWYGLAAVTLVGAIMAVPGFPLDLGLFLGLTVVLLGVLCGALAALIHYLVFLYTSRNGALPYIAAGYAAFFVMLLLFILRSTPDGLENARWGPKLHYATPITSGPLYWAVIILLLVPPIVSALAYLSLYWKAKDPVLKRRILLVSLSIVLWFGSSLLGIGQGENPPDWWVVSSRLISLAAAGTILYAYTGLRPKAPAGVPDPADRLKDSIYEPPQRRIASVHPLIAIA